jgi:hypothetical protein
MGSKSSPASKTVTSKVEEPKPKKVKPAKVKPRKINTVKAQQAPQQAQQQPQYNLSDFSLSTAKSANNIIIITMYQGQGIHVFTLPSLEYQRWQRANYQQKYAYILSQTDIFAFNNDVRVIQAVTAKTIRILDSIFFRAQALVAQLQV